MSVTGLLFATFYMLTALAAVTYYRRRIFSNAWDAVLVGILPLAAAGFLGWVVVKSLQSEPTSQKWALIGIVGSGVILMLVARFSSCSRRSSTCPGRALRGTPIDVALRRCSSATACGRRWDRLNGRDAHEYDRRLRRRSYS